MAVKAYSNSNFTGQIASFVVPAGITFYSVRWFDANGVLQGYNPGDNFNVTAGATIKVFADSTLAGELKAWPQIPRGGTLRLFPNDANPKTDIAIPLSGGVAVDPGGGTPPPPTGTGVTKIIAGAQVTVN